MENIRNREATKKTNRAGAPTPARLSIKLKLAQQNTNTPAADVNSEVVRLRHESELLREALSSLVFKIKRPECAKGQAAASGGASVMRSGIVTTPLSFTHARGRA